MDALISAIIGDLVSRLISFVVQKYRNQTNNDNDHHHRRLENVLLRIHTVVEEAEGRCITNRGMLLQLKMLTEGMYVAHYVLDRLKIQSVEEDGIEGQVTQLNGSFSNAAKRHRFASATTKDRSVSFGFFTSSERNQKGTLESLEAMIEEMRDFVILLGSCPRLPRQPYCTYLFMDKCMFGRHTEKEQIINFLLCNDTDDFSDLGILPVIGPHRVGKKTLVQHACKDERVRNCFCNIFFFEGDDLKNREFTTNFSAALGKGLFVVDFRWDADEAAWTNFKSYLQVAAGGGSKIVLIGRTHGVAKFGTAPPIWLKRLSQEEYWYYFKVLAFGSMDPSRHQRLASLGMQIANELNGSFITANIIAEILRANPNPQFWCNILLSSREVVQKHLISFGGHPEDLPLQRNSPLHFSKMAYVGDQGQACMVYDIRDAGSGQAGLPLLTSQDVLMGSDFPVGVKFDVLVWTSRIPPYTNYIATYEKPNPQRMVGKKNRLVLREI